jgi:hypothetical protein
LSVEDMLVLIRMEMERKIYRTVRLNQFQPFDEATNFPKLLAALSTEEADFDEENHRISPEAHRCSEAQCTLQFGGISFYEHFEWHTQSQIIDSVIDLALGDYSLQIPPTQENLRSVESQLKNLNKQLRKQTPKKKIMAFVCYEYQYDAQNSDWGLCCDHNVCDPDHCTLFPTQSLPCKFVAIKDQLHVFFPALLGTGWSTHCVQLKAESEPPSFHSSFDRELWSSSRVIFKHMDSIEDFTIVTIISNILRIARENSYSSVLFLQNTEIQARKILQTLFLLMEEIHDYSETRRLSWLLRIIRRNIQLKNSEEKDLVAMFGGESQK